MTCNYCGSNWSKDISTKELKDEVERRKAHNEELWKQYVAQLWPTYDRDIWLTILNFCLALIGTSMLVTSFYRSALLYMGSSTLLASLVLAACIFTVLFLPGIYCIRKENRILVAFRKKYPEDAEVPPLF
jgi:hypothetical protein